MSQSSRSRVLRNILIMIVVVGALFVLRFRQIGNVEAAPGVREIRADEGVPVETVVTSLGELSEWMILSGTVEGAVQYPVTSQNALRVVDIPVSEGERVAAGDVVLRLASEAPSPMYHDLETSRASYEKAELDARRARNLFAEGAVSRADLDAAETALAVAKASLQNAEGVTSLCADRAGTVSSVLVVEGETVSTNKPLVWIVDTDEVILRFEAGRGQALALEVGQTARWLTASGGVGGEGLLSQLDLMADPDTHLLSGEARFDNADGRLVPGLLIDLSVRVHGVDDALILPSACLVDGELGRAVWVVGESGRAELRPVTTGLAVADGVEITAGLRVGERVVTYGQTLLGAGTLVKRVDGGEES